MEKERKFMTKVNIHSYQLYEKWRITVILQKGWNTEQITQLLLKEEKKTLFVLIW